MGRGATAFKGVGQYSNSEKDILMVVVKPNETHILKSIVQQLDPTAFMVIVSANEIIGSVKKLNTERIDRPLLVFILTSIVR
jgi:uncharacterized membrane-anchored protein YitT (DUF2179 family)